MTVEGVESRDAAVQVPRPPRPARPLSHSSTTTYNTRMLLTRAEKTAVQEGRLAPEAARALMRRRIWTLLAGVALGYGTLWAVSRFL